MELSLPNELIYRVLYHIDDIDELKRICNSDPYLNSICEDPHFIREYLAAKYGVSTNYGPLANLESSNLRQLDKIMKRPRVFHDLTIAGYEYADVYRPLYYAISESDALILAIYVLPLELARKYLQEYLKYTYKANQYLDVYYLVEIPRYLAMWIEHLQQRSLQTMNNVSGIPNHILKLIRMMIDGGITTVNTTTRLYKLYPLIRSMVDKFDPKNRAESYTILDRLAQTFTHE